MLDFVCLWGKIVLCVTDGCTLQTVACASELLSFLFFWRPVLCLFFVRSSISLLVLSKPRNFVRKPSVPQYDCFKPENGRLLPLCFKIMGVYS